jgi:hypothetical protein
MHTVTCLSGELKDTSRTTTITRPTTLRDARKLGLLPSVTNVLGVIAKPELTLWLQEQAVMAALTLPRLPGETEDAFARRVVEDSQTTRSSAAEFGTAMHHGAERVAQTLELDPGDPLAPWLRHYRDWFQANCTRLHWTERPLVNLAEGYAGTADLLMEHQQHGVVLVDLKTMKSKERGAASGEPKAKNKGRVLRAYPSWCYQLAAYRAALGQPVRCLNLIIDSSQPAEPVEHLWTGEELERGWQAFRSAQELWRIEKKYDPRALESGIVRDANSLVVR